MAEQVEKDMIIKLRLPDATLQKLLEMASNAGLSLSMLFDYFIEDLTSEDSAESVCITDWLCRRSGSAAGEEEEEDEKLVDFSDKQVEIMNLLDLILDN